MGKMHHCIETCYVCSIDTALKMVENQNKKKTLLDINIMILWDKYTEFGW